MLFSVGDAGALLGGGAVVVVVVVVVVVDDGAWLPLVPQPAVNTPTAISTAPPATAIRRRSTQRESICSSYPICLASEYFGTPLLVAVNAWRFCWRRRRQYWGRKEVARGRVDALFGGRRCTGRWCRGGRGGRRRRLFAAGTAARGQRTNRNQYRPTRHRHSSTINAM